MIFLQKLKQCAALLIIILLLTIYSPARFAFADTPTPTPADTTTPTPTVDQSTPTPTPINSVTPTPTVSQNSVTPTPTVDPSATPTSNPTPTVDPSATPTPTADPTLGAPLLVTSPTPDPSTTPCPTPTDSPTPTVDPSTTPDPSATPTPAPNPCFTVSVLDASNSANVGNTGTSNADTGNNAATTTPGNGNASINTGNAVSSTDATNNINSVINNSTVTHQTVNLFIDQNGNLNITDPFTIVSQAIQSHQNDPVINVSVTNVNNFTYLANNIASTANTGTNTATAPDATAVINTGNAYSLVSLLNEVNFTVINSEVHLITINIFGNLTGNVILPDNSTNASSNCVNCGVSMLSANNNSNVNNNTTSTANTGTNTASGSATANIVTGDAKSLVDVNNIINTVFYGAYIQSLFINVLGNWNGNFVGWGNLAPTAGGTDLALTNLGTNQGSLCPSCVQFANINNKAIVINNVASTANTGQNSAVGGNAAITTGNAFSAISLINFINSTFVNSYGFFGFINVFGNWTGDIGGQSNFPTPTPSPTPEIQTAAATNTTEDSGGLLTDSISTNVGEYILPGDTLMFYVPVKNIGTGTVYDAQLQILLMKNGVNIGTASFNLGNILPGKGAKITTGLALSQSIQPGQYTAIALASGNVGPNNGLISANASTNFTVGGSIITAISNGVPPTTPHTTIHVLGAATNKPLQEDDSKELYLLTAAIVGYVVVRALRKKENLKLLFKGSLTIAERMQELRMFLV